MRIIAIIFFTLLLYTEERVFGKDCGDRNGAFWTFTGDDKACNRCKAIGLVRWVTCNPNVSGNDAAGVAFSYTPAASYFTPPKTNYFLRYGRCNGNWLSGNPWDSNGCASIDYEEQPMDSTKIVSSLDDCKNLPNKLQTFSPGLLQNLSNQVCLVRVASDAYWAFGYSQVVCAYLLNGTGLGCVPYPRNPGPPPFTLGLFPATVFSVDKITTASSFNADTSFARPVVAVKRVRGATVLDSVNLAINLEENQTSATVNAFSAQIKSSKPDQLEVLQNNDQIALYPRPAIKQKPSGQSFFPCYATYNTQKAADVYQQTHNLYQGIYLFSLNANQGDAIGNDVNGRTIYLGPNYLPSIFSNIMGDIKQTKCDLCINAAMQNTSQWPDNAYGDGYSIKANSDDVIKITACQLDPGITIQQVQLREPSGAIFSYPSTDETSLVAAPLRVDMIDTAYQDYVKAQGCKNLDNADNATKAFCQAIDPNAYNYNYTSDVGSLDHYLVKVKAVIPSFDEFNEAQFITATAQPSDSKTCNSYQQDVNGKVFITPAGNRDRSYCSGSEANSVYTLCRPIDSNSTYLQSVCPGSYQGPASGTEPDKICLMSADDWDFISGRYQSTETNLNGDAKIVPQMACTFLPGCSSLGSSSINNIGNAIWNKDAMFGESGIKGACQVVNYNASVSDNANLYTYRYDIKSYAVSSEFASDPDYAAVQQALLTLQSTAQTNGKSYISESDLNNNPVLASFYNQYKNQNCFTCSIISPIAQCIGGIYGNVPPETACVAVKTNGIPIQCKISNLPG